MNNLRHKRPQYFSSPHRAGSMVETTGNELVHLTAWFIYNNREGRHRADLITNMQKNVQWNHLNSSTDRLPTDRHTHPKRNGPHRSLFGPSAEEDSSAGGQNLAGYLAASCGFTDSNPPWWDSNPRPGIQRAPDPGCHERRYEHHGTPPP